MSHTGSRRWCWLLLSLRSCSSGSPGFFTAVQTDTCGLSWMALRSRPRIWETKNISHLMWYYCYSPPPPIRCTYAAGRMSIDGQLMMISRQHLQHRIFDWVCDIEEVYFIRDWNWFSCLLHLCIPSATKPPSPPPHHQPSHQPATASRGRNNIRLCKFPALTSRGSDCTQYNIAAIYLLSWN